MKLYVDDMREAPDGWVTVRRFYDALTIIESIHLQALSLDHDLGGDQLDGYVLAKRIIEYETWPEHIYCHSMNPVGRENILALLERYAPEGVTVHRDIPEGLR